MREKRDKRWMRVEAGDEEEVKEKDGGIRKYGRRGGEV